MSNSFEGDSNEAKDALGLGEEEDFAAAKRSGGDIEAKKSGGDIEFSGGDIEATGDEEEDSGGDIESKPGDDA